MPTAPEASISVGQIVVIMLQGGMTVFAGLVLWRLKGGTETTAKNLSDSITAIVTSALADFRDRMDQKREDCQAANEIRFARREDVIECKDNIGRLFIKSDEHSREVAEVKGFAKGVSESLKALAATKGKG